MFQVFDHDWFAVPFVMTTCQVVYCKHFIRYKLRKKRKISKLFARNTSDRQMGLLTILSGTTSDVSCVSL